MAEGKPTRGTGDPEPLEIGQKLNLRRHLLWSNRAARDLGWEVCGYTYRKGGKWLGYDLINAQGWKTSASKFEAIDKVEG